MPKALANRLLHFDIEEDFDEWKKWAIRNGINAKVVGFLTFKPTSLMYFDTGSDSLAFPTPRSWEMVSNLLNTISSVNATKINDTNKTDILVFGPLNHFAVPLDK